MKKIYISILFFLLAVPGQRASATVNRNVTAVMQHQITASLEKDKNTEQTSEANSIQTCNCPSNGQSNPPPKHNHHVRNFLIFAAALIAGLLVLAASAK